MLGQNTLKKSHKTLTEKHTYIYTLKSNWYQNNQIQNTQNASLNISSTKITHNNKISLMFEQKQTHAYKSKCKKKNIKHKQQNEHKYMKQQLKLKQSNTNISN